MTSPPQRRDVDLPWRALSDVTRARRGAAPWVAAVVISMLLPMGLCCWVWSDAVMRGDLRQRDHWMMMGCLALLPVIAVAVHRVVRTHRRLVTVAQQSLNAFHDTLATAHGWIWIIDITSEIVYTNDGVFELLGHRPEDVVGRNAIDLLVMDEDRESIVAAVHASFPEGGWKDWQTTVKHRDGSIRHVRSSATAIRDKDGVLLAYQGSTTDVTADVIAAAADEAHRAERHAARMRVEQVLRDGSSPDIVFQPIVEAHTGRVAGVEALSRFSSTPYRTPDVWFDEAWQVGLGVELELQAMARACESLAVLPPEAYLSLNVSPQTLMDERFAAVLLAFEACARRIVVEVTEHAAVGDYERLAHAVQRLRHTGVRLAVDDAGAGYASMQHILRLRPDIIKLDRGIVAGIDEDVARRALVTAMAGFASSLSMAVVAEGVETAGELRALRDAGVQYAQGYFLARPSADPSCRGLAPMATSA